MRRPRVFATRIVPEEGLALIRAAADLEVWQHQLPPPREEIIRPVRECDGLLSLLTDRIDAEIMDAAPSLRIISNYAVGYDNIDLAAATQRGILVCNTPGVLTEATADLAWALLMASARHIVQADRYVRDGKWKTWEPMLFLGYDVFGATLGLVGLGRIGKAMAQRAKGFAMRVLYFDPLRDPAAEKELGVHFVPLDTLLRESDFVSIHAPLTPETRHLINAERLAMMKSSAILINAARGPIVDEGALIEALKNRTIAGAALDVAEVEPLGADSPLLQLDNVTVVPHIGSATFTARKRMAVIAAENLVAALKGDRPQYLVNPEALQTAPWKTRSRPY